jgi:hypothetical protein
MEREAVAQRTRHAIAHCIESSGRGLGRAQDRCVWGHMECLAVPIVGDAPRRGLSARSFLFGCPPMKRAFKQIECRKRRRRFDNAARAYY